MGRRAGHRDGGAGIAENDPAQRLRALELDLRASEARLRELTSILDTATDGVIILDDAGRILSLNRSAEALFGYDQREIAGEPITVLLAPESHGLRSNTSTACAAAASRASSTTAARCSAACARAARSRCS